MPTELGEQPTPDTEPSQPPPGGADAIEDDDASPVVPDLSPHANPGVGDEPAELAEPEATNEGATTDGASEPEKETPA